MPDQTESITSAPPETAVVPGSPWGPPDTPEGSRAARDAFDRLRRHGFLNDADDLLTDPTSGRPVLLFFRIWKGVIWVVLTSWDGTLAYRIPAKYFDAKDPFKVRRERRMRPRLRPVRWMSVGPLLDVVDELLGLPTLPGHSRFPAQRAGIADAAASGARDA